MLSVETTIFSGACTRHCVAHSEEKAGQVCRQHGKWARVSSGSGSVNSRSESPCDTRCTLALQHNSPEAHCFRLIYTGLVRYKLAETNF